MLSRVNNLKSGTRYSHVHLFTHLGRSGGTAQWTWVNRHTFTFFAFLPIADKSKLNLLGHTFFVLLSFK